MARSAHYEERQIIDRPRRDSLPPTTFSSSSTTGRRSPPIQCIVLDRVVAVWLVSSPTALAPVFHLFPPFFLDFFTSKETSLTNQTVKIVSRACLRSRLALFTSTHTTHTVPQEDTGSRGEGGNTWPTCKSPSGPHLACSPIPMHSFQRVAVHSGGARPTTARSSGLTAPGATSHPPRRHHPRHPTLPRRSRAAVRRPPPTIVTDRQHCPR